MAKIIVNGNDENKSLQVNGRLSFTRTKKEIINNDGSKSIQIIIEGVFQTHLYFEEITELATNRYKLIDVDVYQEIYGSDDYNIQYRFIAKDIKNIGVEAHGAVFDVFGDVMERIENIMYKDEHPLLGDIGPEYKDIVEDEGDKEDDI